MYHVVFCYKSYSSNPGVSHIGLGVTAMSCAKFLNARGVEAIVFPARTEQDLENYLRTNPNVTHVIISALWVRTDTFRRWSALFPKVQFAANCHSNAAFLQSEPEAIKLIKEGKWLEELSTNFHVAGNNERFCSYIEAAYGGVCTYLPNLYYINYLQENPEHLPWTGGTLRIGMFGALRALKNFSTATAAALAISRQLRCQTELWINVGRNDGGDANTVLRAIRNAVDGVPLIKLVEYGWASWPEFRKVIGSMNLVLQPSFTETFNGVSADAVVQGVPVVVAPSIDWLPENWQADPDDAVDVARVGVSLLQDKRAAFDGLKHLMIHNEESYQSWMNFFEWHQLPSRGNFSPSRHFPKQRKR